jgi:hypothetical protein
MQILNEGHQIMSQQSQLFSMTILERSNPNHNNEGLMPIDLSYAKVCKIKKYRTKARKLLILNL